MAAGRFIRFTVSDTGLGVAAEAANGLFSPFSPGDTSYARKEQGAGLGLAVAKRVVEQAGGRIGFESAPGEGAQFYFTLPVSGVVGGPAPSLAADGQQAPPAALSILVFASAPDLAPGIASMLQPFGNRVVMPATMAEAAERAGREHFDAIVTGAAEADMLAAAPGVQAPLIAVLLRGDRAPSATDTVLRWPVEPSQLYRALDQVCEPVEEKAATPGGEPPAAIDAVAFSTLEKSVGVPALVDILQCYIATAEQLTGALSQACAEEKWEDAGRLAQDIVGAAGGLGLSAITQAARHFAQAARRGESRHALRNAAQMVVGEHVRARQALIQLYPDVA
jgi:HPt (histidine-containing phosphotransfer) domain-containing protein